MKRILVTGARGQIGSDLVEALRRSYGREAILATDVVPSNSVNGHAAGYEVLDVLDAERLERLVERHRADTVFHLASLLSARGEHQPDLAWDVNINGLKHVLDLARRKSLKVFWPSSIAVFGPNTPHRNTPQHTTLDPTTMYGVTKVAGELLCRYYAERFGVDVRSLRYPGIISYTAPPGGGTTDYAVEIFYSALQQGSYTCFVRPDTRLPMMYMPDAIRAALELMRAPSSSIHIRTSYNLAAVSFSAEELATCLQEHLPAFTCRYDPDYHQAIADSWPAEIDDTEARRDWGWRHEWELKDIVRDMLDKLTVTP